MALNMLMDSMSIPLFRTISPWLTLRSLDREQALNAAILSGLVRRGESRRGAGGNRP
jgi:hypothetical protein